MQAADLFVSPTPQTLLLQASDAIVERGHERGFITSEDLLDLIPEESLSPEEVEGFLVTIGERLREEGIDIVEVPGEEDLGNGNGAVRHPEDGASTDSLRSYLREIGRVALLTAAEEVDLAMRIEGGALAEGVLQQTAITGTLDVPAFRKVAKAVVRVRERQLDPQNGLRHEGIGRETVGPAYRPRTQPDAIAFLLRVAKDAEAARARLIEANLRLVVSIAKRYAFGPMGLLDLAQEGNLGLMRAVEKFDYTKGYKFSTYATWWIRQAVSRALADQGRVIRIPVHIHENVHKVARAERELTQELRREPVPEEIGRRIGIEGEKVQAIRKVTRDPVSLETPLGEDGERSLGELIEDHDAVVPLDATTFAFLQEQIGSILDSLTYRERRIIALRFGLTDGHPRTLDEIGQEFAVSRERIRQIEGRALSKLRHPSRAQKLRDYLE